MLNYNFFNYSKMPYCPLPPPPAYFFHYFTLSRPSFVRINSAAKKLQTLYSLIHYSILTTHYSFTNLLTIKSGVMSAELGVFLFHYFTLNSVLKTHYSLINFFTSIPFSVFTFTIYTPAGKSTTFMVIGERLSVIGKL